MTAPTLHRQIILGQLQEVLDPVIHLVVQAIVGLTIPMTVRFTVVKQILLDLLKAVEPQNLMLALVDLLMVLGTMVPTNNVLPKVLGLKPMASRQGSI